MLPCLAGLGREEIPRRNSQVTETRSVKYELGLAQGRIGGEKVRLEILGGYLTDAEGFWVRFGNFTHRCVFANKPLNCRISIGVPFNKKPQ